MRTETIEKTYLTFEELTDAQQEWALDTHRHMEVDHNEWWEYTYDSFVEFCGALGVGVGTRPVLLMNGKTRPEPRICFQLNCQGAGSSFEGSADIWELYHHVMGKTWQKNWPKVEFDPDAPPHIPHAVWLRHLFDPSVSCKPAGFRDTYITPSTDLHHYHDDQSTRVWKHMENLCEWAEGVMEELNAMLFTWLDKEYEYLTSDECIKERLIETEYEFDKDELPED